MDHQHKNRRPSTGFTQVPDALIDDTTLSLEAKAVLIWVCSRPDGYICRTSLMQSRFGIGREKWQRIFRELRDVGAITSEWQKCPRTGRMVGRCYEWCWEKWFTTPESRETRPSVKPRETPTESRVSRPSENPALHVGKPGLGRRKPRLPKEEREKGKERAARASYEKWRAWSARTGGGTYGDWLDTEEGKAALREEQAGATHDT